MSYAEIVEKLRQTGQEHLVQFYPDLKPKEQEALLRQLSEIDFVKVNTLFGKAEQSLENVQNCLEASIEPIPASKFESAETCSAETLELYQKRGLKAISEGEVAVLLLAGGQGTRLGVNYPKGMYSVGLPSGKTLFQIQGERIKRLQHLAQEEIGQKGQIPWYIMTSGPTDLSTQTYLRNNNYFGLDENNVIQFKQGLLPCFDFQGKMLLQDKGEVAMAPDGNGGVYRALEKNGILADMQRRNVKYVHVYSVDNILVKVADPVFIGYCVAKNADCAAKVVNKSGPQEAVGVVCQVKGCFQVVEYSEISKETAELTDAQGKLVYNAGNICNHFFTRDFLQNFVQHHEDELKLHVAKKKVPYVDANGNAIKPSEPQAIKIEKFIFDVFCFSQNFVTWEVPRNSEFSALKNGDEANKDCPSTVKRDLLALHKAYITEAGGVVDHDEVEISPLLSYAGENLKELVYGKTFSQRLVLE